MKNWSNKQTSPPGLAQQQKGLREIVEVGTTEAPEGKGRGSWDCGKSLHGPAGRASMGPAHNEVRAKLSLNSELPTLQNQTQDPSELGSPVCLPGHPLGR